MGCGNSTVRKGRDDINGANDGKKKGKEKTKKRGDGEEDFSPIVYETNDIPYPIQETELLNERTVSVSSTIGDAAAATASPPPPPPPSPPLPVRTPMESKSKPASKTPDDLLAYVSSTTLDDTPKNVILRAIEGSETFVPNIPPVPILQAIEYHETRRISTPRAAPIYGEELRGTIISTGSRVPLKAVEVHATRRHPISPPPSLRAIEIYEPIRQDSQLETLSGNSKGCKSNRSKRSSRSLTPPPPLRAVEVCGRKTPKSVGSGEYLQAVESYRLKGNPDGAFNSLTSSSSKPFVVAAAELFHSDMGTITPFDQSSLSGLISSFGEVPLDRVFYSGTPSVEEKPTLTPLKREQLPLPTQQQRQEKRQEKQQQQERLPVYTNEEICPPRPRSRQRKSASEKSRNTNTPKSLKEDLDKSPSPASPVPESSTSPRIIYLPYEIPANGKSPVRRTPSPYPKACETPPDQKMNPTPPEKEEHIQRSQRLPSKSQERPPIFSSKTYMAAPRPNRTSESTPQTEPITEPREVPMGRFPVQRTSTAPQESVPSINISDGLESSTDFLRKAALANSTGWETLRQLRLVLQIRETEAEAKEGHV
ncbi:uncharacterized protein TM35_000361490 [Trypanosoma theileri]|uniref:Uncharacterized protein n=1 Tax=Trypanosoma theileri TaxID=67003 RepID=A0A1X0NMB8_9TRYP|nr:uncharacterized protein TM35_000361490 [Trypanosoma theileri]ORC85289.1 hypothetical protein TM35_000361490 [Trypanosoma theileri]